MHDDHDDSTSMAHLRAHHGDFAAFRDAMIETSTGRFGPIWWGVFDQHIAPPAQATFVDLGTGPGLLLAQLRRRYPDAADIIGVEMQPEMLAAARPLADRCGARILTADLAQPPLPLPDACADVVTAVMSLHELIFPPAIIAEARRLLRPGGAFVLYDWVKRPLRDYLGPHPLDADRLQHFREHCLFSADDLAFLVEQAGLQIDEVVSRRGGHYAILVAHLPSPDAPTT